ncbi:MAG: VWA domain-containing protein [Candidatus Eisenbacteria bacterium]
MRRRTKRPSTLLLAVLFLLCAAPAALAGSGIDWVVLVDDTGTMRYQSRGDMTVKAIGEFVSLVERGDRISICSYGERPAHVLPTNPVLIKDESSKDHVRAHTKFGFAADRTDITAGLEYVWGERASLFPGLTAAGGKGADAVIVLLTDGKLIPVYEDYSQYEETYRKSRKRLLELASLCGEHGIRICTIGLGRVDKVDGELLEEVAARTGGTYLHVADASNVVAAYRTIATGQRSPAPIDVVKAPVRRDAPVEERAPARNLGLQDEATASDTPEPPREQRARGGHVASRPSGGLPAFPSDFCLASAGILAILIGMIAVGTEKRQRWATRFSRNLFGTGQKRVRGYLKPIDPPGETTARANIGLENPGLESVKVGNGTPYLSTVEATLEFIGSTDDSPPELHVEGEGVTVEGEAVTVRKLRDGDIVDVEGLRYQYLRGNRR